MTETIEIGDILVAVTRKNVKNVHLSVHPPSGRVTLVAPAKTRLEVARAFAVTKLGWIREQQRRLREQARETPRQFVERESHYLWGRRYLLSVMESNCKPSVSLSHKRITLTVRPATSAGQRERIFAAWRRDLLHQAIPPLIRKWEEKLGVSLTAYYLQRMKTKWGACNHRAGTIRLNTELTKKPKDLLEYVIVHEMVHLLEPTHSERFIEILSRNYPGWREAQLELNALPLAAEQWLEDLRCPSGVVNVVDQSNAAGPVTRRSPSDFRDKA